jgi:glycosyltransferase involved in cell wall biosynthesis
MPPLISIITPSYNQAQFLEETILSVLGQNYPRLEYIIVDGGSTDGSVDIIKKYADRLAWWVSEKDSGQAEAINKGLKRATGDIVAWINSDDKYQAGAFEAALPAFEAHTDAGFIFGDVLSIDKDNHPINLRRPIARTRDDFMTFRIIGQPGVFMRRAVLEKTNYLSNDFHLLLDHHLWLQMLSHAPAYYVPHTFASARYHAAAKNWARAAEFGAEAHRIVAWMQTQPAFAPTVKANYNRFTAAAHRLDAYYLMEGGFAKKSLSEYLKTFRLNPALALRDWKRIIYVMAALLGFQKLHQAYSALKRKIQKQ